MAGFGGNDAFTHILLHGDGTNGATAFIDSRAGGTQAHAWTANGAAQIDTSTSKFGGASMLFGGTSDWIDTPDSADFTLGSGDFTCDCWFNCNAASGVRAFICGQLNSGGVNVSFYIHRAVTTNLMQAIVTPDGSSAFAVNGTTAITSTGWHHIALVRTGNVLKLFLDGVQEGSTAFGVAIFDSPNKFAVGRGGEFNSSLWNGWIDEFRLSVGVARWTSNFVPPTLPYDTGVEITMAQMCDVAISSRTRMIAG